MKSYLRFIHSNWRFLSFGMLLTFLSSFGQTFFIGMHNQAFREAFELSNTAFGTIYGAVTMMSAACLVWLGKYIDRTHLPSYTVLSVCGLLIGCLGIGLSPSLSLFIFFLFLVRFTGQGLMGHISMTSMSRYFNSARGRAYSLAKIGFSLGEIVFPLIALVSIAAFGWRMSWSFYALFLAFAIIPVILWLLADHKERHKRWLAEQLSVNHTEIQFLPGIKTVLRDPKFYFLVLAAVTFPFIATGIFFFQEHLSQEKGWPHTYFATAFSLYAITAIIANFIVGFLIDKYSSRRMLPVVLLPLCMGLCLLAVTERAYIVFVFMGLLGLTNGLVTIYGPALAEMYGTRALGEIKSLFTAIMVFSSSLAPPIFGYLLDSGISFNTLALYFMLFALIISCTQIPLQRKIYTHLSA